MKQIYTFCRGIMLLAIGILFVDVAFSQNIRTLPFNFNQETFGNKTVIYKFNEVPGEFRYIFTKGGTYNNICKSNLYVSWSADGNNWHSIRSYTNSFNQDLSLTLSKTARYIKFDFDKCWSNGSTANLQSSSYTKKSIDCSVDNLDFGSVTVGDSIDKSIIVNWASNVSNQLIALCQNSDFKIVSASNIPVSAGNAGSKSITIRYKPTKSGSVNDELSFTEENYTQNTDVVKLTALGIDQQAPVLQAPLDQHNTGFTIHWTRVPYAEGYEFDLYKKNGSEIEYVNAFQNYFAGTNTSHIFPYLEPDQTYYMKVRSKTGTYVGPYSNEVSISLESYFHIELSSANPEMGSVNSIGTVKIGTSVTASATAKVNCGFVRWEENENIVSTDPNYSFSVSGPRNLKAHFISTLKEIAAFDLPRGSAIFSGSGLFNIGEKTTLKAKAKQGYYFLYWADGEGNQITTADSIEIDVLDNISYTAHFGRHTYQVYTHATHGEVSGEGSFLYGDTAVLLATEKDEYWVFQNYTENGQILSTQAKYSFIVEANREITANFAHRGFLVNLAKNPENGGNISGNANVPLGNNHTVSANPASGFSFVGWFDTIQKAPFLKSNQNNYSFTPDRDILLTARFASGNERILPFNFPGQTFSGDKTLIYSFKEIPGEFFYNFSKGGAAYNSLCKSTLSILWSPDNVYWQEIASYKNEFSNQSVITLPKTARYVQFNFDKCGTNASTAVLQDNSFVSKSIDCNLNSLDFGSITIGDSVDKNIVVNWASNVDDDILISCQNSDFQVIGSSVIPVVKGEKGSRVVMVRYKPTKVGNIAGNIIFAEKNLVENMDVVGFTAKCTDQAAPVLENPKNLKNQSFDISWTGSKYAQSYEFDLYQKNGNDKVYIGEYRNFQTSAKSYSFSNLNPDQTYYMVVRSLYNNYHTPNSNEVEIALVSYFDIKTINKNPERGSINSIGIQQINTQVCARAKAKDLCAFEGWYENNLLVSTDTAYCFTVIEDRNLQARFISLLKEISAVVVPMYAGTVSNTGLYSEGEQVELIATPNKAYVFNHWSLNGTILGNTENLSLTVQGEDAAYEAHFIKKKYTISVFPAANGHIEGQGVYEHGDTVVLRAIPDSKYYLFDQYMLAGSTVSNQAIYTFIATKDMDFAVSFSHRGFDISTFNIPIEGGVSSGGGTIEQGKEVVLSANPSLNFKFAGWFDTTSMEIISKESSFRFTPDRDSSIQARFAYQNQISLPYYFPNDIVFSGEDQSIIYYFSDVPGTFFYDFKQSGTTNELCKHNMKIHVSSNGQTWTELLSKNGGLPYSGSMVLKETIRYIRFSFTKCWSNASSIILTANTYILKSIDLNKDMLDFEEVYLDSTKKLEVNLKWDKNISPEFGKIRLESSNEEFSLSSTSFSTLSGYSGQEKIYISYKPKGLYKSDGFIKAYNIAYPENFDIIRLTGAGTDHYYTINTLAFDNNGNISPEMGKIIGSEEVNYIKGTQLRLETRPKEGYHLKYWKEGDSILSRENFLDLVVLQHRNIEAHFDANIYVNRIQSGIGGSSKFVGKENHESLYSTHGEKIVLEASPDYGYHFSEYISLPYAYYFSDQLNYSFISTQDRDLKALFDTNTYVIHVKSNDSLLGKVKIQGDTNAAGEYKHFSTIKLSAETAAYCHFSHWENQVGDKIAFEEEYIFDVEKSEEYTAIFGENTHSISLSANLPEAGELIGNGSFSALASQSYEIEARSKPGYYFLHWLSEDGSQIKNNPHLIVDGHLDFDISYTAVFDISAYSLNGNSEHGKVLGYGYYRYMDLVNLKAKADSGYYFAAWTNDKGDILSTEDSISVQLTQDSILHAIFKRHSYTVSTHHTEGGSVSPLLDKQSLEHFYSLNLQAIANENREFRGWTENGDTLSKEASYSIIIDRNRDITANFSFQRKNLSLSSNYPEIIPITGGGIYEYGSTLRIKAPEKDGYTFAYWVNEEEESIKLPTPEIEVNMDKNLSFRAEYRKNKYLFSATSKDEKGYIYFGQSFQENYQLLDSFYFETPILIQAQAKPNYYFSHWEENGDSLSSQNYLDFVLDKEKQIEAIFLPQKYEIGIAASPSQGGKLSGGGIYPYHSLIKLKASFNYGYYFLGWQKNGAMLSTDSILEVRVESNDFYTAVFRPLQVSIHTKIIPEGAGTVEGSGEYDFMSKAGLIAQEKIGYHFVAWLLFNEESQKYDTLRKRNTLFPLVEKEAEYIALFEKTRYKIDVALSEERAGYTRGKKEYVYMDTSSLEIICHPGFRFISWEDKDGNILSKENMLKLPILSDMVVFARFERLSYRVNAKSEDSLKGRAFGSGSYLFEAYATLSSLPKAHYEFSHWENLKTKEIAYSDLYFSVKEEQDWLAYFSPEKYNLHTGHIPAGSGKVIVKNNLAEYTYLDTVSLKAEANYGYRLKEWVLNNDSTIKEEEFSFTISQNSHCLAIFEPISFSVNTNSIPEGAGEISPSGLCIYQNNYPLKAKEKPHYDFVAWLMEDEIISYEKDYHIQVNKDLNITALFSAHIYSLTTKANHPEYGSTLGANSYPYGDSVEIYAIPNHGYQFCYWISDKNDTLSKNATTRIFPESDLLVTAVFAPNIYTVKAFANIEEAASILTTKTHYEHGESVSLGFKTHHGYAFNGWYLGRNLLSQDSCFTFNATKDVNIEARFKKNSYHLSLSVEGKGQVTGAGSYPYLENIRLRAIPEASSHFSHWSKEGEILSSEEILNWELTEHTEIKAHFALNTYPVEVRIFPENAAKYSGAGNYTHGDTAILLVEAKKNFLLSHWKVNNKNFIPDTNIYSVFVDKALDIEVYFVEDIHLIDVQKNYADGGEVFGQGMYYRGDTFSISAHAAEGYHFGYWTEGNQVISTDTLYSDVVKGAKRFTAGFLRNQYTIQLSAEPIYGGLLSGNGSYFYEDEILIQAIPSPDYLFSHWSLNERVYSQDSVCSFICKGPSNLSAHFIYTKAHVFGKVLPENSGRIEGLGLYPKGSKIELAAYPNEGYIFENWKNKNGDILGSDALINIDVQEDTAIEAHFMKVEESNPGLITSFSAVYNPLDKKIHLKINIPEHEKALLQICDMFGKVLLSSDIQAGNTSVDCQNLSSGIYICRIMQGKKELFLQKLPLQIIK